MMTEEPNDVFQESPPLERRGEALHPGGSSPERPVHQRSVPSPSDRTRPVLCLGTASPSGRSHGAQEQQARTQGTRPNGALTGADSAAAGGDRGDLRREPGPQKGGLAGERTPRLSPESRARVLASVRTALVRTDQSA